MPTLVALAEPTAQPISVQTALLIILGIGCVFMIRSLARLHRRVDELALQVVPQAKPAARHHGRLHITPFVLVFVVIGSTDVLFAVDSIPAIMGISQDPFVVLTSNIFAVLGGPGLLTP